MEPQGGEPLTKKRLIFPTLPTPIRILRASELIVPTSETWLEPPDHVKKMICDTSLVASVHIETHDILGSHMKWWRGPFGFWTLADPQVFKQARIVQIGWYIYDDSSEPVLKQRLIRPVASRSPPRQFKSTISQTTKPFKEYLYGMRCSSLWMT